MNDSQNPVKIPEQTVPQSSPSHPAPAAADTPSLDTESTGTMAAPSNYNSAAVLQAKTVRPTPDAGGMTFSELGGMAGRYALIRSLAKGGMGLVSVARDTELDREVALKEIQHKFTLDAATLHRFTLEARVTGKLEHPGVVPVYGLGVYPDGRPYYAMRFITGKSLQDAIDEFHEKDLPGRDPQEQSLALRQLLRRFVDVCNTIGYAHSRGFLHRDIKPANVMLGGFGETLVVDWGLAKEMGKTVNVPATVSGEATTINQPVKPEDFAETLEGFTLFGQTMGTPAYMSPEQAAGRWDVTGVASDVYSLGAMLYSVLSGTPPYSGPSYEVITRVQRGDYKPPKLVKGSVPGPLDAVVRKAMAFDIKDRYPNAQALAMDVERWLADEPVSCYRESYFTRFMRWAKRNRTAVVAASALVLTGTLALAIGLFAVNAERKRTEIAKIDAEESRGEARDALLTLTDDALSETLASTRQPTPQQVKFLETLIDRYRQFAARSQDTVESKLFVAGAWYRIGRMEARVNRPVEAFNAYDTALTLATDKLVSALPDAKLIQGDALLYSAILELQKGMPGAEIRFLTAKAIFEDLRQTDPKPLYRSRLAQCQDRLGVLYVILKKLPEAEALFRDSLAYREQLLKESPENTEYRFRVAQSDRQFADVLFRQGKKKEGLDWLAKARAQQEQVVKDNPNSAAYLALLADLDTLLTAATAKPRVELPPGTPRPVLKDEPSLKHARAAAKSWSHLAALNPGDATFRRAQAEANVNLARIAGDCGLPREALANAEAALSLMTELNEDQPNDSLTQTKLLQAQTSLAYILRTNRDKTAMEKADVAITAGEALSKKIPTSAEVHSHTGLAHIEKAMILLDNQKTKEARAQLDLAWPHIQASRNPQDLRTWVHAVTNWMDDAEDFADADKLGEQVASLNWSNGQAQYEAACLHGRVANIAKLNAGTPADLVLKQMAWSVKYIKDAIAKGFHRIELLESDPDLQEPRRTNEFQALLEELKSRGK